MKLKSILICLIIFSSLSCNAIEDSKFLEKIIGVWNPNDREYRGIAKDYYWGLSKYTTNVSVTFLTNKNNELYILSPGFVIDVISINKIDENIYELFCYVEDRKKSISIELLGNNEIKIINGFLYFDEEIYKKIGGPNIPFNDYYISKNKLLVLKNEPSQDSSNALKVQHGEKLLIIEYGQRESINNIEGYWLKVKNENGSVGWCFDAYLEKME
jgi:hypothetical protein